LCGSIGSDGVSFLTGTAYDHLRLYDSRTGQRPSQSYDIATDFSLTTVCAMEDGVRTFIGDGGGNIFQHDLRTGRRLLTLKGGAGGIKDVKLISNESEVAAVGLDRHLRVYDSKTGKLRRTVYLKNRQTAVIELGRSSGNNDNKDSSEDEEGEEVDPEMCEDHFSDFVDSEDEEDESGSDGRNSEDQRKKRRRQ
jgi:WD40 repeat protein